jgi:hypothetical protein
MKSLDQHFHLQKLPMFFIGQGLMALALFVRGTKNAGRSARHLLNPVA